MQFEESVSVSEDEPIDTTITRVQATDADSDEFGRVMYYLTQDENGKFKINTSSVSCLV